jgi:hypothetical protein
MELQSKWNFCVKCKQEQKSRKKVRNKILTWTMNLPHCLPQKCQKLSQLPSSWTPTLEATLIVATLALARDQDKGVASGRAYK